MGYNHFSEGVTRLEYKAISNLFYTLNKLNIPHGRYAIIPTNKNGYNFLIIKKYEYN